MSNNNTCHYFGGDINSAWIKEFHRKLTPDTVETNLCQLLNSMKYQETSTLESLFTMDELEYVVHKRKKTSPGLDGITYECIQHWPLNGYEILLNT